MSTAEPSDLSGTYTLPELPEYTHAVAVKNHADDYRVTYYDGEVVKHSYDCVGVESLAYWIRNGAWVLALHPSLRVSEGL